MKLYFKATIKSVNCICDFSELMINFKVKADWSTWVWVGRFAKSSKSVTFVATGHISQSYYR